MKKNFWKKLLAIFGLGICVFGMSACQTTDHTSRIVANQSSVSIGKYVDTGKTYADIVLYVENPTIYDAKQYELNWESYDSTGAVIAQGHELSDYVRVAHGAYGVIAYRLQDIPDNVASVKVKDGPAVAYYSVWETYLAAWIITIVIVAIALIGYSCTIFVKGLTKDQMYDIFRQNVASSLIFMMLMLLICLVPLMFANWVVTCILLGGYASFLLLSLGVTGLRIATSKN